jgi:D-alanyl-lipoteichoic acid acyltransferase DltB (MBOAT superfamily)
MLFSSPLFIFVFLPAVMLGFQILGVSGRRYTFTWLSLVSLVFYGYWNPKFVFLLAGSVLLNFLIAKQIVRSSERARRGWLLAGICLNIGALVYFKYLFPFLDFLHSHGALASSFGSVVLPLGISFFTFTQIGYLVDLEQGMAQDQDLISYTLFVTFFPHLIAGPIVHHREMMPQFAAQRRFRFRAEDVAVGLSWFITGLFKKVVIADYFGHVAYAVFKYPQGFGVSATWAGVLCYSLQLYFDFSGYSDMAIGLARMFSIRFPLNFNSPYKAANIIEFWQRWHMTLTRYLTLYVYNPVSLAINRRRFAAGKKVSKKASATLEGFFNLVAVPTLFTMFVAGVWHGAGFQFLVFGVLHGIYLCVNHAWRIFVPVTSHLRKLLPRPLSVLLTYIAVLVGQVFFRAGDTHDAVYMLATMLGIHGKGATLAHNPYPGFRGALFDSPPLLVLSLVTGYLIVWGLPNTEELLGEMTLAPRWYSRFLPAVRWRPNLPWSIGLAGGFLVGLLMLESSASFLYFQF